MIFTIFSCENDIEDTAIEKDKLLGTWELRNRTPNGIEYCERFSRFTFEEDEYLEYILAYGDEASACEEVLLFGTWEFLNVEENEIFFEVSSEDQSFAATQTFTYRFLDEETMEITYQVEEITGVETYKKQ